MPRNKTAERRVSERRLVLEQQGRAQAHCSSCLPATYQITILGSLGL